MLTYADLAAMPDDGTRHELLDGELIVSPSANTRHQRLSVRLAFAFHLHIRSRGGGEIFEALDVVFADMTVVQPDVLFIADDQQGILTDANVQGVPALVIEIVSDSRYDRVRKRDIYARFGVPEYWIVDPDADRIEVYRLQGNAYVRPQVYEVGDSLAFGGLPGMTLDLNELFAR